MTGRFVIAVSAAAIVVGGPTRPLAQSPQAPSGNRTFEVASIKPALSTSEFGARGGRDELARFVPMIGFRIQAGGRFNGSNVTLKQLIAYAFDVRDYQIDGGPNWLTTDYFDIAAVAGAESTPAEMRSMVRALLTERFALRTHDETRQAPVHVMTLARSDGRLGPGLKPTSPECVSDFEQRKSGTVPARPPSIPFKGGEFPNTPTCGMTMMMGRANGGSTVLMGGMDLTSLVRQVSGEVSTPVVDKTGLSGLFDITLDFMSERQIAGRAPGLDPNGTDTPPPLLAAALHQTRQPRRLIRRGCCRKHFPHR